MSTVRPLSSPVADRQLTELQEERVGESLLVYSFSFTWSKKICFPLNAKIVMSI